MRERARRDVGALRLDIGDPAAPRLASRLEASEVGVLRDAAIASGRIFLLGERGLQLMDPEATRISQSIDVARMSRVAAMGRHLVSVGEQRLQVVDATPLTARAVPAASDPATP